MWQLRIQSGWQSPCSTLWELQGTQKRKESRWQQGSGFIPPKSPSHSDEVETDKIEENKDEETTVPDELQSNFSYTGGNLFYIVS